MAETYEKRLVKAMPSGTSYVITQGGPQGASGEPGDSGRLRSKWSAVGMMHAEL
jgi:hypothetical protein